MEDVKKATLIKETHSIRLPHLRWWCHQFAMLFQILDSH